MILIAIALALQAAAPPQGSSSPTTHMGWHSCEDWTRAREVRRAREMEEWVWGYLTALGRYGPRRSAGAPEEMRRAIWGRLDVYCAGNQRATFGNAVRLAVEGFRQRRPGS